MLALIQESFISEFFSELGYFAPFTILLLCGCGLPIPEELTMIASGFLLYQGRVEFWPIVLVCWVATLLGDTIPYTLGRKFGANALRLPIARRVLHPERFALLEKRFERHGNWAVFTCRFLPGVRLPGFFSAGTLGMKYPRFIIIDGIGAAIMAPLFIWLGHASGEHIARLEGQVQDFHHILGFIILALVSFIIFRAMIHRRERQVARLETVQKEQKEQPEEPEDVRPPAAPPEGPLPAPRRGSSVPNRP